MHLLLLYTALITYIKRKTGNNKYKWGTRMKKIILLLAFLIPTMNFSQSNTAFEIQKNEYDSLLKRFIHRWDHYTQCFRTTCSPEEKYRRWESASKTAKDAIKSAVFLAVILYGTYYLLPKGHKQELKRYIKSKTHSLSIEKASTKPSKPVQ